MLWSRWAHPSRLAPASTATWSRDDREIRVTPGREPSDHVSSTRVPQFCEYGRCEDGRAPVVAEHNDLLLAIAEVRIAKLALGGGSPLEHRPRNMQRAGHDAAVCPVAVRADVDQNRATLERCVCFSGREPLDARFGSCEKISERTPFRVGIHPTMICHRAPEIKCRRRRVLANGSSPPRSRSQL